MNLSKLKLLLCLVALAAIAAAIWFVGPAVAIDGRAVLDSEARRLAVIGVLTGLFAIVLIWRIVLGRRADRRMAADLAGPPAAPAGDDTMVRAMDEADALRNRFRDAMAALRRSKRQLRDLPWYVLIGPPGAGKTMALKHSGLGFPLAEHYGHEALRGVGGTRDCDWWFTDEAVLLDTAGRYLTQDSDESVDSSAWGEFLKLLRRYRRRRPINGIIVAISLADILDPDPATQERHARSIRRRIREIDETLGLRFPVYVMLTKADLVAGFTEFFETLDTAQRNQVWGLSFEAAGNDPLAAFAARYDALVGRLNDRLLTRLDEERDPTRRALLFGFPREVAMLKADIARFLDAVFAANRYDSPAWLRGVYLTSATQQGTPIDRALGSVARSFGLQADRLRHDPRPRNTTSTPRGGEQLSSERPRAAGGLGARSYFLADLLRQVIFPEAELVASDQRLERRRRWLHGAACGLAALGVASGVALWTSADARNQAAIERLHQRVQSFAKDEARSDTGSIDGLLSRLDALQALANDGSALSAQRDYGLQQARHLHAAARRTYLRELNRLLAPRVAATLADTLRQSQRDTESTYAALKGYLMLGEPQHRDPAYLKALMQIEWEGQPAGSMSAAALPRLQTHLDELIKGGLDPVSLDALLLRDARATLNRVPLADLAYGRMRREAAARDDLAFVPRDALGAAGAPAFDRKSGKGLEQALPGFYTARGYAELFLPQSRRLTETLRSETWVLGDTKGDTGELGAKELATLGDDVARRYFADYRRAWQDLLADLRILPFRSPAEGLDVLARLSGRNSPLRSLLLAVDRNTSLLSTGSNGQSATAGGDGRVRQARTELLGLLRTSASPPQAEAPAPGSEVDAAFADLDALVRPDKDGHAPLDTTIAQLAQLYAELDTQAPQDGKDPAPPLPDTPAARQLKQTAISQPQPLKDWLLQVADNAQQAGDQRLQAAMRKKRGDDQKALRDTINAAWKNDVLPFCLAATGHRYPLDKSSATDVTPKDFGRLFAPGGLIDAFVKDKLRPFIDSSRKPWRWRTADELDLGASAESLHQLEGAAALRDAYFGDGGPLPAVEFAIKPLDADPASSHAVLTVGAQQRIDPKAPAAFQTMRWPAPDGAAQARIVDDSGTRTETRSADGPWAWYRLLDQATLQRVSADRVVASFRLAAHTAQYELRAASVINPFQVDAAEAFQCPKGF